MKSIVLVGGGGHCISCIDVLEAEKKYWIAGILDTPNKIGKIICGYKIIGTDDDMPFFVKKFENFLITVGQIRTSEIRIRLYEKIKNSGGHLPIIISPYAFVSKSAVIKEGTIIMHNSLINANAFVGRNCIINTGALVEHEAKIEDFCHISTHAIVNGQVTVGKNSFIGSNSVIANNVTLPEKIIISAGACILKTPLESGIYIGNPAKKIRSL